MTPPPDAAVAAPDKAFRMPRVSYNPGAVSPDRRWMSVEVGGSVLFGDSIEDVVDLPADWTLSRRSERESLVAAIPEDPRCADHTLAGECHWCGAALDDGDSHDPTCRWVKARAAIEGRP